MAIMRGISEAGCLILYYVLNVIMTQQSAYIWENICNVNIL